MAAGIGIGIGFVFLIFFRLGGGASPQGRKKAENKANGNGQKSLNILKKLQNKRANYSETPTKRSSYGYDSVVAKVGQASKSV